MNKQKLKKVGMGLAMALSLSFLIGIISAPEVQAQSRDYRGWRDRDGRRDDDRNSDWSRRQQIERARAIERARQREWERRRNAYRYGNQRNYPYYGGSYGGYSSSEEQRGYRNGLKEGQDDARDRDSFNPNRHSSFRDGNPAYRSGFQRGYQQGYRQYAYSRRW